MSGYSDIPLEWLTGTVYLGDPILRNKGGSDQILSEITELHE